MNEPIAFLLNQQQQSYIGPSGLTVLDYLREEMRMTGTKEGCREGDCGACTVMLGTCCDGHVVYRPATSCLVPMAELRGRHLVTIEGLQMVDLTLVQRALIAAGAIQCGFCTPGIVMSITCYLLQHPQPPDEAAAKAMLSGHLCRCTGYAAIKRACELICDAWSEEENENDLARLIRLQVVPPYFARIPALLSELPSAPVGTMALPMIAGGTDLYVQKGVQLSGSDIYSLSLQREAEPVHEINGVLELDGMMTFQEFMEHPLIRRHLPVNEPFYEEVASWQVRHRATIAGNLVNASPIADLAILLLSLGAELILHGSEGERTLALASFFTGYKTIAKRADERIYRIRIGLPPPDSKIHFTKVCKRRHLDIASVNSAVRVCVVDGTIRTIDLSFGGVAPVPLWASKTGSFLQGKRLEISVLKEANRILQSEIHPIDDVRGSATYKRVLARQLLLTHFVELYPNLVPAEAALWI